MAGNENEGFRKQLPNFVNLLIAIVPSRNRILEEASRTY